MDLSFNLNLFSKYRTELMGLSAIGIILCHSVVEGVKMNPILAYILGLGNVGVDIFLFLSGVGMYYSIHNAKRGGVIAWYKKRYVRILIPYMIITLPWWIYFSISRDIGLTGFILNVTTLNYWVIHMGAWYVALLIPLYLITPLLAYIVDRSSNRLLVAIITMVSIFILTNNLKPSLDDITIKSIVDNIQKAFCRSPIYIFGYAIAPQIQQEYKINLCWFLLFFVLQLAMPFIPLINEWQRYCIMAIPFAVILCYVLNVCNNRVRLLCKMIGTISLESYLANVFVSYFLKEIPEMTNNSGVFVGNYLYYSLVVVFGFVYAISAYLLNKRILK